ncbi:MAG: cation:proton antiporter [Planctomycetota bacterium]|nr:cation:proton antiporter [Planctomycetota bacterium]
MGKGVIFSALSRLFCYRYVVPLAVGLGMFQVGEFSFLLAKIGVSTGSISDEFYSLILSVSIVTMILTPIISSQTARLYSLRRKCSSTSPLIHPTCLTGNFQVT